MRLRWDPMRWCETIVKSEVKGKMQKFHWRTRSGEVISLTSSKLMLKTLRCRDSGLQMDFAQDVLDGIEHPSGALWNCPVNKEWNTKKNYRKKNLEVRRCRETVLNGGPAQQCDSFLYLPVSVVFRKDFQPQTVGSGLKNYFAAWQPEAKIQGNVLSWAPDFRSDPSELSVSGAMQAAIFQRADRRIYSFGMPSNHFLQNLVGNHIITGDCCIFQRSESVVLWNSTVPPSLLPWSFILPYLWLNFPLSPLNSFVEGPFLSFYVCIPDLTAQTLIGIAMGSCKGLFGTVPGLQVHSNIWTAQGGGGSFQP